MIKKKFSTWWNGMSKGSSKGYPQARGFGSHVHEASALSSRLGCVGSVRAPQIFSYPTGNSVFNNEWMNEIRISTKRLELFLNFNNFWQIWS